MNNPTLSLISLLRWRWVVNYIFQPLYFQESAGVLCIGRLMGPELVWTNINKSKPFCIVRGDMQVPMKDTTNRTRNLHPEPPSEILNFTVYGRTERHKMLTTNFMLNLQ